MGQSQSDSPGVIMDSPKLLLILIVVSFSMAAPQINQRQVVGDVISQLQPAILEAVASLNLGGSSSSFPSRSSSIVSTPRFTASSPSSLSLGSRSFSGSRGSNRNTFSSSSSPSVASVTSSVVSSLQPSIAAAVAQALAGRRSSVSSIGRGTGSTGVTTENNGPARYDFTYKVAEDESQTYIAQQENREGDQVTGSYNYVDPTGSLVTVNYQAGPEGYSETRDVAKGAVEFRNNPGPWTGPLAGVDDGQTTSTGVSSSSSGSRLSQSDIISQILAAIQPKINTAVQSAISSSSFTGSNNSNSGLGQNRFTSSRTSSSRQNDIINSVISALGPRIKYAVNSAISTSRTVSVPRSRTIVPVRPRTIPVRGGNQATTNVFGEGGTSVSVETPEYGYQF